MTVERLRASLADRYRIERELGAGGMATVYLAQDLKHDRQVAVKVLRPELAAVIGADRFLTEIKTTANLQHPHILPLFDSGAADSFLFYVMPYIEGETLRDRLTREKQLSVPDAVRIASEVASALDYAHRHGVIHRDIKPENILLHDGSALVADFGIALAASKAGSRMTETGMSLGTPHYMSPEQAMGEREITARSDVYALGCVLYEMLVGQPPFTGATAQAIVAKVVTEKPAALIAQRDTIPEPVEDAILTALAKLPADRFASAAEFATALASRTSNAPRRAGQRTLGGWRIAAILAGTAVVAGIAGALLRGGAPSTSGSPVRFSVPVHLGDIDFGPGLDISRDGTEIVFIGRNTDGPQGLFRLVLAEGEPKPIPGTIGAIIRSPVFSPDGRSVAYTSQSQLHVISIAGGNERALVDSVSPTSGGLSWGPGDNIVFQRNFGAGLSIVSAKGGPARPLTRLDSAKGTDHRWPYVLPDGKSVVFTVWNGITSAAHVAIASLATGAVRDLFPGSFARYSNDGYLVYVGPNQTLQRVAFDLKSGRAQGEPVMLRDSVYIPGDGAAQFAISATGTFASLKSLGRRIPVLVDRNGVQTDLPGMTPNFYNSPRFSPDGRLFSLEVGTGVQDLWVYDMRAETFAKITDDGGFYSVWTPDGARLLYSRDEAAEVNVYSVPVNRSAPRRPVVVHHGQARTQDLSHDGKHLLLRQNVMAGQYDLFVVSPDSAATPVPWLATPFLERAPAFSPNDRWVAYSSNESGKDEVYVSPFAGAGGRIPISSGGGIEPAWSPDGTELYYRTLDGLLQGVKVDAGQNFKVLSRPVALTKDHFFWYGWARQYDVAPDAKHFLFLRNETIEIKLNVVLNWTNASKTETH